jgi:hypothetical protein
MIIDVIEMLAVMHTIQGILRDVEKLLQMRKYAVFVPS